MKDRHVSAPARIVSLLVGLAFCLPVCAQTPKAPDKVYVPYKELRGVFESEKQGVFLPYDDFRRLWVAAQGEPAAPTVAPVPYLISTARFTGSVGADLATMELALTVDILADGWVEVPLSLGQAAVAKVTFLDGDAERPPLLRVINGKYILLARDKGRRALRVEFVRQLVTRQGLNILKLATPAAAITTLELLIPEENMKVDVKPLLAATTTQVTADGKKATKLQAFLGSGGSVELSWKPKAQAAEALPPVVISEQLQHIHVDEALINHDATFTFDVRRRGVGSFTIELPPSFRVTSVEGDNIRKWDISAAPEEEAGAAPGPQVLRADLFTPSRASTS